MISLTSTIPPGQGCQRPTCPQISPIGQPVTFPLLSLIKWVLACGQGPLPTLRRRVPSELHILRLYLGSREGDTRLDMGHRDEVRGVATTCTERILESTR